MSDNIIEFPNIYGSYETTGEIPPERVLQGIEDNNLTTVVVLGSTEEGEEYFASSTGHAPTILWMIKRLEKILLETPDDIDTYE